MKATFLLAVFAFLMVTTVVAQPEAAPVCEVNGQRPPGAICIIWNSGIKRVPLQVEHYTAGQRLVTDIGSAKFDEKKSIELRGALAYNKTDPGPYFKEDQAWTPSSHMQISVEFLDLLEDNIVGTVANPNLNEPIPFKPGTKARVVVVYKIGNKYGPRIVSMDKSKSSLRAYVY